MRALAIVAVAIWTMLSAGATEAATLYLNEAAFITAEAPTGLTDFEGLAITSGETLATVTTADVILSTVGGSDSTNLGVRNTNVIGSFGTHGPTYVRWFAEAGASLVFTFDSPLSAFGVTLTDPLESGGASAAYGLRTNGGDNFPSALLGGMRADGSTAFLGLSSDIPFTTVTITNFTGFNDNIGLDGVRYEAAVIAAVPEPGVAFLWVAAAAVAVTLRRSMRRV